METPGSRRFSEPLGSRVDPGADAVQIGRALVAIWHEIEQALNPIIGRRGVDALYRRALHLTAVRYPWVGPKHESSDAGADPRELGHLLAQQSNTDAAEAAEAFLQTFHALLGSLVGESLTRRLLRSVWTTPAGEPPAQDSSP